MSMARRMRSGTLLGPGICRKWRPLLNVMFTPGVGTTQAWRSCAVGIVISSAPNAVRPSALGSRTATGTTMAEAGETSPHLDQKERRQAAAGAPMGALVIHEIVRAQGEEELDRSFGGLAWSGIA